MLTELFAGLGHGNWMMFALATLAVLAGALVQGASGVGLGLVAAPALMIIDPQLGPGPLLVLAFLLSAVMIKREFGAIDRQGLALSMCGRVAGSVVAGAIYALLPLSVYELLFGLLILGAVGLSLLGLKVERTPWNLVSAGFTSGIMGTLTSAGSPTMALVYQRSGGATIRATLAAFFLFSSAFSLMVLFMIDKFGAKQLLASLFFLPSMLVGFWLSSHIVARASNEGVRWLVLGLSGASSLLLVGKAVVKLL